MITPAVTLSKTWEYVPSKRDTSVDVPPMSNPMICSASPIDHQQRCKESVNSYIFHCIYAQWLWNIPSYKHSWLKGFSFTLEDIQNPLYNLRGVINPGIYFCIAQHMQPSLSIWSDLISVLKEQKSLLFLSMFFTHHHNSISLQQNRLWVCFKLYIIVGLAFEAAHSFELQVYESVAISDNKSPQVFVASSPCDFSINRYDNATFQFGPFPSDTLREVLSIWKHPNVGYSANICAARQFGFLSLIVIVYMEFSGVTQRLLLVLYHFLGVWRRILLCGHWGTPNWWTSKKMMVWISLE